MLTYVWMKRVIDHLFVYLHHQPIIFVVLSVKLWKFFGNCLNVLEIFFENHCRCWLFVRPHLQRKSSLLVTLFYHRLFLVRVRESAGCHENCLTHSLRLTVVWTTGAKSTKKWTGERQTLYDLLDIPSWYKKKSMGLSWLSRGYFWNKFKIQWHWLIIRIFD